MLFIENELFFDSRQLAASQLPNCELTQASSLRYRQASLFA